MRFSKTLAAALALTALSTLAAAHSEHGHSKAIDFRNSLMTILKWNMGPMGKMVKGEMPYDEAAFTRHAQDLATTAHLDLPAGFPEGSEEGDTDARIDIWMDWEGFMEKYEALKKASAELARTAATGSMEAIKPKFVDLGKTCKSCHDAFKD